MKQVLVLLIFFSFSPSVFSKKDTKEMYYNETYRNQFHFSSKINKIGSPISIWMKDSTVHFYYQYNPYNLMDGYVNWGQATSTDLLHWKEQPIAISQPETVSDSMFQSPWWGAVCDEQDNAVAWVNRWDNGVYQTKSIDGTNWDSEVKCTGINWLEKGESYVFWYEAEKKWIMVAYDRANTTMYFLSSSDGQAWEQTSKFNYQFGFPQFLELPVDRKSDDTRWVLITEKGTYMLGDFDGVSFKPRTTVQYFNQGKDVGGSVVFKDTKDKRTLVLSQLKSEQQADLASNGSMTFPAELSLHGYDTGVVLQQKPIEDIKTLSVKDYQWADKKIYPGMNNNLLKKVKGTSLRITGVIDVRNSDKFGFIVRSDRYHQGNEIVFNVKKGLLNFLNSEYKFQPNKQKVEFELLIDQSTLELYIDGGRYLYSTSYSPLPTSLNYELFTIGGEIYVEWMELQRLSSMWGDE